MQVRERNWSGTNGPRGVQLGAGKNRKDQGPKSGVGTWFHANWWIMTLVWPWNFVKELVCT